MFKVLGHAVKTYGAGKDGGRDFTLQGQVTWNGVDGTSAAWDGYVVGQVKFRQDRLGTTHDQNWFIDQVERELLVWANPKSERRVKGQLPEYLIFVTNVALSPAAGGGRDRFDSLMHEQAENLGIRGWRVFPRDAVERLLDADVSVRKRFAAFIAPADVFADASSLVSLPRNLDVVLSKHALKMLGRERIIRLSEQGFRSNDKLFLEQVCTDLNATLVDQHQHSRLVQTVKHILEHGDSILAPRAKGRPPGPTHFLLVGDPGQGKTTLSQMLTQFYRVALVRNLDLATIPAATAEVVRATRNVMADLRIAEPRNRRWPIRVDLAAYGDAIAGGEDVTLIRWVTRQLRELVEEDGLSNASILKWLEKWPWLVVLDGLDEVAHPSVREHLRAQVEDFMLEAADADADLLVVITTRPQGYDHYVSEDDFQRLRLAPLSRRDALNYANRLSTVRNAEDEELHAASLRRLDEAFNEPSTARLMQSPLQVTIMLLLAEIAAKVPTGRYELFSSYYETIYAREVGKKGAIARLLEVRRSDINALHQEVGLRLQVASERDDNAEAVLPLSEFREIAVARLIAEGVKEAEIEGLVDQLESAALTRLVLVVPKGDGVGFEVRSLQEFMAASALTTGADERIVRQLAAIGPAVHWRNTWLLAFGRVFAEHEHLRGSAVNSLREVDAGDALDRIASLGPDLSMALLAEGIADRAPAYLRLLLMHGLETLDVSPALTTSSDYPAVLARIGDMDEDYLAAITRALTKSLDGSFRQRASAMILAFGLQRPEFRSTALGKFVKGSISGWQAALIDDEHEIIEVWHAGGGVMRESVVANYPSGSTRTLNVAKLALRALGGAEFDGRERILEALRSIRIRVLTPDLAFALPPSEPFGDQDLATVLERAQARTAFARFASELRPSLWTILSHFVGFYSGVRSRRQVGVDLLLSRSTGSPLVSRTDI